MATSRGTGERFLAHDELLTWAGYPVTACIPYTSAVTIFRGCLTRPASCAGRGSDGAGHGLTGRPGGCSTVRGDGAARGAGGAVRRPTGAQEVVTDSWLALVDAPERHLALRANPDPHDFPAIVRSHGWAATRQHAEAEHAELLRRHEAERRALETFTARLHEADARYRSTIGQVRRSGRYGKSSRSALVSNVRQCYRRVVSMR
jgi:hypothetical protein